MKTGTLYGIGVGPGDPELITLKAINTLRRVSVIYAAASTKSGHSIAEKIISPHLNGDVPIERLKFPMTRDREELKAAWQKNADIIIAGLKTGRHAALITLGDPMTYSTFGYIMQTIKQTDQTIPIKVIPGITSYQACSASAEWVLAEGEESFSVISGAMGPEKLKSVIEHTDNVVMLKVYRNYREILKAMRQLDLSDKSVLVSRCGLEEERIIHNINKLPDEVPPYLSLLLIRKKKRG